MSTNAMLTIDHDKFLCAFMDGMKVDGDTLLIGDLKVRIDHERAHDLALAFQFVGRQTLRAFNGAYGHDRKSAA